jgi:hypothetical protein
MKRAFITFGNVFGLALYDKDQTEVGYEDEVVTTQNQDHDDHPDRVDTLTEFIVGAAELNLRNALNLGDLKSRWERLPANIQSRMAGVKEEMKAILQSFAKDGADNG